MRELLTISLIFALSVILVFGAWYFLWMFFSWVFRPLTDIVEARHHRDRKTLREE